MGIETERSADHRWLERKLSEACISFQSEQPFLSYSVDVYLPEWHIGVEVDGPTHSKPADAKRDAALLEGCGLVILHLDTKFKAWKHAAVPRIIEFIEQNASTAEERKDQWRQKST